MKPIVDSVGALSMSHGAPTNITAASRMVGRKRVLHGVALGHDGLERPQRERDEHGVEGAEHRDPRGHRRSVHLRLEQRRRPRTPAMMTAT